MSEKTEKEISLMNMLMLGSAGICVLVAVWVVLTGEFRAGTDDLFLVIVCLSLALLLAAPALLWARSTGRLNKWFGAEDEPVAETHEEAHAEAHDDHGGNRINVIVWGGLLGLTAIEVFLAYIHLEQTLMLAILMLLSIMKAALIIAYFMHMKFERLSFVLTIVPTLVVLLCLFAIFFPDGNRAHRLKPSEPPLQVEGAQGAGSPTQ
jgi:cytochrome c oxidase subunit 4